MYGNNDFREGSEASGDIERVTSLRRIWLRWMLCVNILLSFFSFLLFQWIFIRKIIRSVGVFASRMGWMIEWMWIFTSVLVIVLIFVGGEELLIFSDESILLLFKYRRWKFVLIWDIGKIFFSREYIVVLGKNRNYFKLLVLLVNSDRNGVNYNRMLYFITLYINCTSCLS